MASRLGLSPVHGGRKGFPISSPTVPLKVMGSKPTSGKGFRLSKSGGKGKLVKRLRSPAQAGRYPSGR